MFKNIEDFLIFHSPSDPALMNDIMLLCSLNDPKECLNVFLNVRNMLFPSNDTRLIQEICINRGIDTSLEYSLLRLELPNLPLNPCPENVSWYDFLHPKNAEVISFLKNVLIANNLLEAHVYDEWRNSNAELRKKYPSVQHINDGYFGSKYTSFNDVLKSLLDVNPFFV